MNPTRRVPLVLVVDEHSALRQSLRASLVREGWRCVTAGDAGEAVARLEAEPVTHVIVALPAGVESALDLMRTLKMRFPHVRVLVLTEAMKGALRSAPRARTLHESAVGNN